MCIRDRYQRRVRECSVRAFLDLVQRVLAAALEMPANVCRSKSTKRIKGASTRAKKRRKAAEKVQSDLQFIDDLFEKYDTSKDGLLEIADMTALITKMNNDKAPTQEEVDLIVKAVDKRDGNVDGKIDKGELKEALLEWRNYNEHSAFIEGKFSLYDTDFSGSLDRNQLKVLLTDLNEGHAVADRELDLVINYSDKGAFKDGCIDKTELVSAIAVWFSCTAHGDEVVMVMEGGAAPEAQPEPAAAAPAAAPAPVKTTCCVLM
eukprot:TRINITY_DN4929_c0_g1_i1.p1 TRINITY_DN4929_c0_g1~~TRINITY_DN4929_c0_g1_i1.p1  ORF type:complete len:262 (+),score=90.96 TRINITY_DN4929_c0_g1_i1:93-878(+)